MNHENITATVNFLGQDCFVTYQPDGAAMVIGHPVKTYAGIEAVASMLGSLIQDVLARNGVASKRQFDLSKKDKSMSFYCRIGVDGNEVMGIVRELARRLGDIQNEMEEDCPHGFTDEDVIREYRQVEKYPEMDLSKVKKPGPVIKPGAFTGKRQLYPPKPVDREPPEHPAIKTLRVFLGAHGLQEEKVGKCVGSAGEAIFLYMVKKEMPGEDPPEEVLGKKLKEVILNAFTGTRVVIRPDMAIASLMLEQARQHKMNEKQSTGMSLN